MKKVNLRLGLLALAIMAMLTVPQAASAFSLRGLFFTNQSDEQSVSTEQTNEGQVLSSNTEQEREEEDSNDKVEEESKPAETIVVVVKGDNLSKIAKAHGTTYQRLFYANESIKDPNIINPGQSLRIPEADEELAIRPLPEPKKVKPATNAQAKKVSRSPNQTRKQRATAPQSAPVQTNAPAVASGSIWDRLAQCESGGRWNINTGNGYYGGLQFHPNTWRSVGGTGLPHQHSREEQIRRAEILLARSGWGQWPACTKKLGLR